MTVGSLFSGIGGMDLGLERAGFTVRWQVEIDPFCRRVLAKHWPDVARYEDVRDVGAHNLKPVDLICGGFPCQDISNAGKRAGIEGERSGLWSEYARIVREMGPRFVLVENVAALLGRGLDRVLGDLAACGYDAEWDCISAAAVGAPHLRDRLFVVAFPTGQRCDGRAAEARRPTWLEPQGFRRRQPDADLAHSGTPGCDRSTQRHLETDEGRSEPAPRRDRVDGRPNPRRRSVLGGEAERRQPGDWWSVEPDVGRVADGVPARVDRLRSLGNAVVPQVAEYIGRSIGRALMEEIDDRMYRHWQGQVG